MCILEDVFDFNDLLCFIQWRIVLWWEYIGQLHVSESCGSHEVKLCGVLAFLVLALCVTSGSTA